ncbi:MAG: helix-turn-helix domain-containing protein [Pseudomonadota bacterium]
MVAVRQFDEDEALDAIMRVFWTKGFRAASIDDIVSATGLKRGSLYAAFGDKAAMYAAAHARYRREQEKVMMSALSGGGLRDAFEALFAAQIDILSNPATPPGCLITVTFGEAPGRGDALEETAGEDFERARAAFRARLEEGRAELRSDADLEAVAAFYTVTIRGIAALHRLRADRAEAEAIAAAALSALPLRAA